MPFADLHCDTISRLHQRRRAGETLGLRDGQRMHINLEKLKRSGYALQNFALFVDLAKTTDPWGSVLTLAELYISETEANRDLVLPARSFSDLEQARREGKIASVLTVEEGGVCKGDLDNLHTLHRLGARMLTLTWNYENELSGPNGSSLGLKDKGYEFLAEMEQLGMIPDVSHLSDQGFWDVCRAAKKPFAASHSSCRALRPHQRNLTDEMLRALADRGGIAGVNFYADFLGERETSRTADIVRHMKHMKDVAGLEVVALGSDFDGIGCPLELGDAAGMDQLTREMERAGFTPREIDAICWENVWRFYQETL